MDINDMMAAKQTTIVPEIQYDPTPPDNSPQMLFLLAVSL